MVLENISIIVVIAGTMLMALAVDAESLLRDTMKRLGKDLRSEGLMVPARTMLRKWPYWGGLVLIGVGTALKWSF